MMTPAQLSILTVLGTLLIAIVTLLGTLTGMAYEACQLTHSLDVCVSTLR